jgi:hypothetical protein
VYVYVYEYVYVYVYVYVCVCVCVVCVCMCVCMRGWSMGNCKGEGSQTLRQAAQWRWYGAENGGVDASTSTRGTAIAFSAVSMHDSVRRTASPFSCPALWLLVPVGVSMTTVCWGRMGEAGELGSGFVGCCPLCHFCDGSKQDLSEYILPT